MSKAMNKFFLVLCVLPFALLFAACGAASHTLDGADRDAVLAYAEAKTDNLLTALNKRDYAAFSRDLNAQFYELVPEHEFDLSYENLSQRVGKYQSRVLDHVETGGGYVTVLYRAKFELEDNVAVRVMFDEGGEHRIAGLWFDSPKLKAPLSTPTP